MASSPPKKGESHSLSDDRIFSSCVVCCVVSDRPANLSALEQLQLDFADSDSDEDVDMKPASALASASASTSDSKEHQPASASADSKDVQMHAADAKDSKDSKDSKESKEAKKPVRKGSNRERVLEALVKLVELMSTSKNRKEFVLMDMTQAPPRVGNNHNTYLPEPVFKLTAWIRVIRSLIKSSKDKLMVSAFPQIVRPSLLLSVCFACCQIGTKHLVLFAEMLPNCGSSLTQVAEEKEGLKNDLNRGVSFCLIF